MGSIKLGRNKLGRNKLGRNSLLLVCSAPEVLGIFVNLGGIFVNLGGIFDNFWPRKKDATRLGKRRKKNARVCLILKKCFSRSPVHFLPPPSCR